MGIVTTYDALDKLYEFLDVTNYRCDNWCPSMKTVKEKIKEYGIEDQIEFLIWILETSDETKLTTEDKDVHKYINQIVNSFLEAKEECN